MESFASLHPNTLFPMTDQMQARVLEPDNPCQTLGLDRLAAGGVRFRRAYTPLREQKSSSPPTRQFTKN